MSDHAYAVPIHLLLLSYLSERVRLTRREFRRGKLSCRFEQQSGQSAAVLWTARLRDLKRTPSTQSNALRGQTRPTRRAAGGVRLTSNPLQILDQILLVRVAEVQLEMRIIVVHHVEQGGEAPVVEEAALLMRP